MQESHDDEALLWKLEGKACLTNTDILSDHERLRARCLLAEAEDTLFALQREIARLTAEQHASPALEWEVNDLMTSQDELDARVSRIRVAIAPHRMLPPEILSHIFLYCVGSDVTVLPPDASRPPWSLSRVCSQWRNVISAEPLFWSRIYFDLFAGGLPGLNAAHEVLESKKILSIRLECSEELASSNEALETLIIPRLSSLRHLDLCLPYGTLRRLVEIPPKAFSFVESLHINVDKGLPFPEQINELRNAQVLTRADNLQKLQLSSSEPKIVFTLLGIQIPWHQITDLELITVQALPFTLVHDTLQQCVRLESLSVEVGRSRVSPAGCDGDCRLPRLRRLTLTIEDAHILKRLTVPSLAELHLSGDFPFPNPELSGMIRRSRCKLLVLDYDGGYDPIRYDVDALNDFLTMIPSLTSFFTFFLILRKPTLDRMAYGELLPNLRAIQIRIDSPTDFVDLIEARMNRAVHGDRGIRVLHEARGYFVRMLHTHDVEMDPAVERLQAINRACNTSFTLMED